MSTNYTETLGLSLWAPNDPVLRTEFNINHQKLDSFIRNLPRIEVGSYIGTGTYGSANPNSLTFGFEPMLVIIVADEGDAMEPGTIFINGQKQSSGMGLPDNSNQCLDLQLTWTKKSVSWYTSSSSDAENQMNAADQTYRYFAVGV